MKLHIGAKILVAIPLIAIVSIVGVCIYGNTPAGKAEKAKNLAAATAASASEVANMKKSAVLDVTQFAGIKPDQLIKIMGKPKKTSADSGNTYYEYNKPNYWCEFTVWDGTIKKLQICSPKHENGKGANFPYHENDDAANLKAFGVIEQYQPSVNYTGYVLNLTNGITDTISEMKFQSISEDKKSFETLWVNY